MTKLIFNTVDSRTSTTEFKDIISANGSEQWLDSYGVIKGFKNTIDESVTIPVKFAPLPTKLVAVIVPFVSMRAFSVPLILKPKTPFPILLIFVSAPILIPASPR